MNKKLTLSLEESVIDKAKRFAHDKKESLSQLVENYFKLITSESSTSEEKYSPIVKELIGSLKVPDDFNYDDIKFTYLKEKYLND